MKAILLAVATMHFLCYHINAEACTTQQQGALRRLYLFPGYSLHAGYNMLLHLITEYLCLLLPPLTVYLQLTPSIYFTTTALCIFLGKNLEKCYDTIQSTALFEISITCAVNTS